jgi:hypothetical protein
MYTCTVSEGGKFVRAVVGPGPASDIQNCYRSLAVICLEHGITRALVIGGNGDASSHLALRDGIKCVVQAGLAPGFRLALVASPGPTQEAYGQALEEAHRLGVAAALFADEGEAAGWLEAA